MNGPEVVISFANERGNYFKALERLRTSLHSFWRGDFIGFEGEWSIGSPKHVDNPYAFKIYCFQKALERGYRKILYVDSSVYAVRNIQPVFDRLNRDGYVMQEAGHYINKWTTQPVIDYFGVTREQLGDSVLYGNAGFLGLDFDTEIAREFFLGWKKSMEDGMFKGSWDDFRHDMSCGSVIAWKLGMLKNVVKGDQILEYAAPEDPIKNDTIVFKAQGI